MAGHGHGFLQGLHFSFTATHYQVCTMGQCTVVTCGNRLSDYPPLILFTLRLVSAQTTEILQLRRGLNVSSHHADVVILLI